MSDQPDDRPKVNVITIEKAGPSGLTTVVSNAFEAEDAFVGFYQTSARPDGQVLEPPYSPVALYRKAQENNALVPCIDAMLANIDGTGMEIEPRDQQAEDKGDDSKIDELWDFFNEPYPGESFMTIRKKIRRDKLSIGYGCMEIMRNPLDEIVMLRHVEARMVRLVRLDAPVPKQVNVMRKGKPLQVTMPVRERRYAQCIQLGKLVYFKELGAERDLHKLTGEWHPKGSLPFEDRATEMLMFGDMPDAHTAYHVPRWIPQLPSVLGSRSAEELNLEFFESGGVPPVIFIVQGGQVAEGAEQRLQQILGGKAKNKTRGAVLEVMASSGSIDKTSNVRVGVERFGSEKQQDSMFENYDSRAEMRVRRSFRLPPLFVGAVDNVSFATAFASYTVAEAQVFKPERDDFDEVISIRLLPLMGYPEYKIRSLPMQAHDATVKLQGLEMARATNRIDPKAMVYAINEVANLALKPTDQAVPPDFPELQAGGRNLYAGGKPMPARALNDSGVPNGTEVTKSASGGIMALAKDAMLAMRSRDVEKIEQCCLNVLSLSAEDRATYKQVLQQLQFVDLGYDVEGLGDLAQATVQSYREH